MAETRDTAQVAFRPPRFLLLCLAAGLALDVATPLPLAIPSAARWVGLAPLAAGVGLMWAAMRAFAVVGTPVPTSAPTAALATLGPYRRSRNPIYLALLAIYTGLALALASPWALTFAPGGALALHFLVVKREERYLGRRFGAAYADYTARVPRWL